MWQVCKATVALVNYGAHANGVSDFTKEITAAAAALERECGDAIRGPGRPQVFFRTTPEGNPWCNSKEPEHQFIVSVSFVSLERCFGVVWSCRFTTPAMLLRMKGAGSQAGSALPKTVLEKDHRIRARLVVTALRFFLFVLLSFSRPT